MLSEHGIKYPHLVNLSTIISILLCFYPITRSFDFSNLIIKFYNMTSYGCIANLIGCSFLYSLYLFILFLWQFKYSLVTYFANF
jgi:hypothetical protein